MVGARVTLAILFLAEIAAALPSGLKQNFVTAALAVAIPYTAGRNKVPRKLLAIVVIVLLAVVIPFTAAYRAGARQPGVTGTAGQAVASAPQILRSTVTGSGSLLAEIPKSVTYLLERSQNIDSAAIIIQRRLVKSPT